MSCAVCDKRDISTMNVHNNLYLGSSIVKGFHRMRMITFAIVQIQNKVSYYELLSIKKKILNYTCNTDYSILILVSVFSIDGDSALNIIYNGYILLLSQLLSMFKILFNNTVF